METKYNVFISYSRKDLERVEKIKEEFELFTGAKCWMDLEGISYDSPDFVKVIGKAINMAPVFLFMLSEHSQNSEIARGELTLAKKRNKHIAIINIDNCEMTDEFTILFSKFNLCNYSEEKQKEKLFKEICSWLGIEFVDCQAKEAKRKREEQQKLIDGIRGDCTILNNKETQLEIDRKNLLVRTETVAAQEQRKELKSFIKNSSPIAKKYEEQLSTANKQIADERKQKELLSQDLTRTKRELEAAKKQAQHNPEKTTVKPNNKKLHIIYVCIILLLLVVGFGIFLFPKRMSPEEQYLLGGYYYTGGCITKDYNKAVEWFLKAAEQGNVDAQYYLGECYYYGRGITKDYDKAVTWYKKAAKTGYAAAQNNLGECYYFGDGVTENHAEAVKWYRKAAEQGYARAQNNLGECYDFGDGITRDHAEAVKWYLKAAEQGYSRAQNNLGDCNYKGLGVTQDYAEAVKWYLKAAEQGYSRAQNNLGDCNYKGLGVTQDYAEAVKWYRKAAEQGNSNAQYNLGNCYYYGDGVTEDYAVAMYWYRKAAEQGNTDAKAKLEELQKLGY